ncbi:MAG TPA: phosphatidylserine decarboxylase [Methanotrichaceae archaeon]|nr:phosphatidylserine decarboxylase [Methanotrichaceae archaeon]
MKLARGSAAWISTPLIMTAMLAIFGIWYASALAFIGSIFLIFFHRDPDRFPIGDGMVSPADGKIVVALPQRIAIFMSPFDVHVNRSPMDGEVLATEYKKGKHAPAFLGKASENQRNLIEMETTDGNIDLCQMTGAIVRRILCYVRPGDQVARGERIGMIRFGSRVEVTIPLGYELFVKKGDRVRAGETIIAVKVS